MYAYVLKKGGKVMNAFVSEEEACEEVFSYGDDGDHMVVEKVSMTVLAKDSGEIGEWRDWTECMYPEELLVVVNKCSDSDQIMMVCTDVDVAEGFCLEHGSNNVEVLAF